MARILVVDDTLMTHRLLQIMLSRNNHTVINAYNGREALKQLKKTVVDLIITDISMPLMDGLGLTEAVHADERLQHLPIIFMTSSIQAHQKLLSSPRTHKKPMLTQPITSRELNDVVTHCLQLPVCAD